MKTKKDKQRTFPEVRALLLSAGLGTRLEPLTYNWPKCLMPIGGLPLLEHWLGMLYQVGLHRVLVNVHHHAQELLLFLKRPRFSDWVNYVCEKKLLGTAGTLKANKKFFCGNTTLLIHSDNWCQFDFRDFLNFHQHQRPKQCKITMMTFNSPTPQKCGILEIDQKGIVNKIHEKVGNPPGTLANGAVYLLEPEIMNWLENQPKIIDFSTEVLPNFLGGIATWHNKNIHRDIGELKMLKLAQSDSIPPSFWPQKDSWQKTFLKHPIHQQISKSKI